jgi:hypothetical protein
VPKARYSIVNIFGDFYYVDNDPDIAIDYMVVRVPEDQEMKNEDDINRFV